MYLFKVTELIVERVNINQEYLPRIHTDWLFPQDVATRDSQDVDKEVRRRMQELGGIQRNDEKVNFTEIEEQLKNTLLDEGEEDSEIETESPTPQLRRSNGNKIKRDLFVSYVGTMDKVKNDKF